MDALQCLLTRRSAKEFAEPAPTREQLTAVLSAAACAPDHKLQRPWRFVVVRGDERARVAAALDTVAEEEARLRGGAVRRQSHKPLRAPVFIVVVAAVNPDGPAPRWEQVASASAAAENMCLAAHALGLASAWRSVPFADSAAMRELFGLRSQDEFVGWVDLGRSADGDRQKPRRPVPLEQVCAELTAAGLAPLDGFPELPEPSGLTEPVGV